MIDDVPRPRPPNLQKEATRHGKTVWYVRVGKGPRIRLTATYGTDQFKEQYDQAIEGKRPQKPGATVSSGSLKWALDLYRQSNAWGALSAATRRQRENIFKHVLETGGDKPVTKITGKTILAGVDRRAATPASARNFLEAMRGLFKWALVAKLVPTDPTTGIEASRPKTDGFPMWTETDLEAYRKRWKVGTRERVAMELLFYTGLRRGDAVTLGRPHIGKDGIARIDTEKTGERVFFEIEPELAIVLAAGPCGDLTFIAGERGLPMVKESFGTWFRIACRAAKVYKSAHGLRKAGATRDAERGWTEAELDAKYGWRGGQMAAKYTRGMNRERLSVQAGRRTRQNIP